MNSSLLYALDISLINKIVLTHMVSNYLLEFENILSERVEKFWQSQRKGYFLCNSESEIRVPFLLSGTHMITLDQLTEPAGSLEADSFTRRWTKSVICPFFAAQNWRTSATFAAVA